MITLVCSVWKARLNPMSYSIFVKWKWACVLFVYMNWWRIIFLFRTVFFRAGVDALHLKLSFLFLFFFSFCFCCLAGFSGHRIHIKKHGSVVECYVHVCWYTVLWRVCVRGVQIVGCVFSSSLFVLMFAANMTTVTSPLKAQAPTLLPF